MRAEHHARVNDGILEPKVRLRMRHERCKVRTRVQAPQAGAIDSKVFQVLVLLFDGKLDENQVEHVAHAVEWEAEFLFPDRIPAVVLDCSRLHSQGPRGRRRDRRGARGRRVGTLVRRGR